MSEHAARRWLHVRHDTVYHYAAPVELAHHLACLRPRETERQQLRHWRLDISPRPDRWEGTGLPRHALSEDVWGNGRIVFSHNAVHERLVVSSSFEAGLLAPPPLVAEDSPPWEQVAGQLRYQAGGIRLEAAEFTLASPLARPEPALAEFAQRAFTPGRPLAAAALALMAQIHAGFRYVPHSTDVATDASQVLALGQGVCQDFAHLLIAACRSLGLAARYVSGYLLTQPPPGQPRLVGADASHAWAEVWCPRQGWIALDPTNDMQAGLDHVLLAWGRDYADVAPLRGVIRGGGQARPQASVTVEPVRD
ncbi:transglutaminase family protein [Pelomonas sp. SE-A7]|uniref:transglutaminase family protein n=1 Tax=Pelomonas sp. SE-A7 TaxID=3054953 RepID=UPI00259CD11D|nr:transglutaminase family protein [Pelomonas sp. SE-A7]MDM4766628.1 transglutaminase family protein [Pelomonas sp. SE-A7]